MNMRILQKTTSTIMAVLFSVIAMAQDEGLDIDVKIGEEGANVWYQNPLYWIIGALLVIILIAVLTKGSRN